MQEEAAAGLVNRGAGNVRALTSGSTFELVGHFDADGIKGMPVHIPIGGTFVVPPCNEGTIITGSKTVNILGSSAARLTSMVMTCNDPVNLPTSVVMAIPMGPPVFIGGPTGVDIMAALLAGIRTKWVSDKLHDLLKAKPGSWRSKIICFLTGHPIDVASGRVLTEQTDFTLPSPIPLTFTRHYDSASRYDGPLGRGWHHGFDQHIATLPDAILLRAEDGRVIEFDLIEDGGVSYEPLERLELRRDGAGYVVRTPDRRLLGFGARERATGLHPPTRSEDLNGNAIRLGYTAGGLHSPYFRAPMNFSAFRGLRPRWSARPRMGRSSGTPGSTRRAVRAASRSIARRSARPGRVLHWRSSSHHRSLMKCSPFSTHQWPRTSRISRSGLIPSADRLVTKERVSWRSATPPTVISRSTRRISSMPGNAVAARM